MSILLSALPGTGAQLPVEIVSREFSRAERADRGQWLAKWRTAIASIAELDTIPQSIFTSKETSAAYITWRRETGREQGFA